MPYHKAASGADLDPFKALDRIDAYRDVRGGKVTQKEPESALQRPYCPLVH